MSTRTHEAVLEAAGSSKPHGVRVYYTQADLQSAERSRKSQAEHTGDNFFAQQEATREHWVLGTPYPPGLVVNYKYFAAYNTNELISRVLHKQAERTLARILGD